MVLFISRPRPKKASKKKLRRSPPKALQNEDSDKVWNELSFYRRQAKNYEVEKCVILQDFIPK